MKRPGKTTYLRWAGYITVLAVVFMLGAHHGARTGGASSLDAKSVNMLAGSGTDAYKAAQAASRPSGDRARDAGSRPRSGGLLTLSGEVVSIDAGSRSLVLGTESGRELSLSVVPNVSVSRMVPVEGSKIPKSTKITFGDVQNGDSVRLAVNVYGDGSFLVQSIRISSDSQ